MIAPRLRPVVSVSYVPSTPGRWRVQVQYPGREPHTLLSAPDRVEADRAARGYVARYCWQLDREEGAQ